MGLDLSAFNAVAARCSDTFIVAASRLDDFAELASTIGTHQGQVLDEAIGEVIGEYLPPIDADNPRVLPTALPFQYQVTLPDWGDQAIADALSRVVNLVVRHLSATLPLERLDGFTFAVDYPAALRTLDRGFAAQSPLETMDESVGTGVAMAPLVCREGVTKVRIIMRAETAYALVANESPGDTAFALHVLVSVLAEAGFYAEIEAQLPGLLLHPLSDAHSADLYSAVHPAIVSYVAARTSAGFGADEEIEEQLESSFPDLMTRLAADLDQAKAAFESDRDVDGPYAGGLAVAAEILSWSARLAGHRHGLERAGLDGSSMVADHLERLDLRRWFTLFESDLDRLWRRRGHWETAAEFTGFTAHVERLLWQFGLFTWRVTEETTWVQVMPGRGGLDPAVTFRPPE